MKNKWGYIVAFCVGLIAGGFCAMLWSGYVIKTQMGRMGDASSQSEILNAYAPLKLINDGKTNKAVSLLELSLDSAVVSAEFRNQYLNTTNGQELIVKAKALLEDRKRHQSTEPGARYGAKPRRP